MSHKKMRNDKFNITSSLISSEILEPYHSRRVIMNKTEIYTPEVPRTRRPFCQGISVKASRLILTSGMTARNQTGEIIANGDIRGQTRKVFENIQEVLKEANASLRDIFKMTVYLRRNEDYDGMNEIRKEFFREDIFVSCTIITELHSQDALVEIQIEAAVN